MFYFFLHDRYLPNHFILILPTSFFGTVNLWNNINYLLIHWCPKPLFSKRRPCFLVYQLKTDLFWVKNPDIKISFKLVKFLVTLLHVVFRHLQFPIFFVLNICSQYLIIHSIFIAVHLNQVTFSSLQLHAYNFKLLLYCKTVQKCCTINKYEGIHHVSAATALPLKIYSSRFQHD